MGRRDELQALLLTITDNVYFQPAPNFQMQYPCIVYRRDSAITSFADNTPYKDTKRYQVTVIDAESDSLIPDMVRALPLCRFDRFFTANSLNHDVFNLYF